MVLIRAAMPSDAQSYARIQDEEWDDSMVAAVTKLESRIRTFPDNGWCTAHTDGGRVLFGVDLSVSRRAPRSTAALMFMAGIELTIRKGAERSVWGGRMPRYHRVADQMSAVEFAGAKNSRGRHLDPEIELYSKIPGVEILGVVPEYFKDWESMNYGVMFSWRNPVYRYPFLRPFRRQIVAGLYRASRRKRLKGRLRP